MTRRLGLAFLALGLMLAPTLSVAADELNTAAVVIRFDDDRVETRCVSFAEPSLSGEELLQQSGLATTISAGALGQAVCAIGGSGCPADDCFCECRGASCTYWSYWHLEDDAWRYATVGAAAHRIQAGGVDGWSWGPGSVSEAIAPPLLDAMTACEAEPSADPAQAGSAVQRSGLGSYLVFGGVVLVLGGVLLWQQRKSK